MTEDYRSLDPETFDHLVSSIAKGLAYQENGGKLDLNKLSAGKTGEMKSIYQFLPSTWKAYAKETLGDENAPLNNENESKVVYKKVEKWLKEGRNIREIASMWNAGEGRPDAYKKDWRGTNNGVPYDTPKYAENVANYSKKFFEERTRMKVPDQVPMPNSSAVSQVPDSVNNPLQDSARRFFSQFIKSGVQTASAQEKPSMQNMPLMQQNTPQEQPTQEVNSQNIGLLKQALSTKK